MDRRTYQEMSSALGLGFLVDDALIALELYEPKAIAAHAPSTFAELRKQLVLLRRTVDEGARIVIGDVDAKYAPDPSISLNLLSTEIDPRSRKQVAETLTRFIGAVECVESGGEPPTTDLIDLKAFLRQVAVALLEAVEQKQPHSMPLQPLTALTFVHG